MKKGRCRPVVQFSNWFNRRKLYTQMHQDGYRNTTQVELDRVTHQDDFLYMLSVLLVLLLYVGVTVGK